MIRNFVGSSSIKTVGYEAHSMVLEVEFWDNNSLYRYFDVPEHEYQNLVNAASIGTYFKLNVQDRYHNTRVY